MELHIKNTLEHIKEFKIIIEGTSLEIVVKWGRICPIYAPKSTKWLRHQFCEDPKIFLFIEYYKFT